MTILTTIPNGASYKDIRETLNSVLARILVLEAGTGTPTPTPTPTGVPAGAAALLYAEDADGLNAIRNRAEVEPSGDSIWGPTRPSEHPLLSRLGNNVDVVPIEQGADGQALAVRLDFPAATNRIWFTGGVGTSTFPGGAGLTAGTWTFTFQARTVSGGNQAITISDQSGVASTSGSHAITSSWQTFSSTLTVSSAGIARINFVVADAGAAGSIAIDNIRLVPGATAGAVPAARRPFVRVGRAPRAGAALQLSAGSPTNPSAADPFVYVPRGGPASALTEVTFAAAVKQDRFTDFVGRIRPLIGAATAPYADVGNGALELGSAAYGFQFSGIDNAAGQNGGTFFGPDGAGWVTVIALAGSSGSTIYINGVRMSSSATPMSSVTMNAFALFGRNYGQGFEGQAMVAGVWERALSASEVTQLHAALVAEVRARGETFIEPAQQWISEGDSITAGQISGGYIANAARRFAKKPQAINYAVPGDGIGNLESRKAVVGARIAELQGLGKEVVLSVLVGANNVPDIAVNPTAYAARVAAYWAWAKGLGCKVVGCTMTAYNNLTTAQQSAVASYTAQIRTKAQGGQCDALCDFAAGPMGTWSSTTFFDDVHPNLAGYEAMGADMHAAIAPLLPDRS